MTVEIAPATAEGTIVLAGDTTWTKPRIPGHKITRWCVDFTRPHIRIMDATWRPPQP